MAFDEKVRARVAAALKREKGIVEKRMFGGVAFLHKGNMALGVQDTDLMVKVGAAHYEAALSRPHARPMDFTGKPLTGYVYVAPAGYKSDRALGAWVASGLAGAATNKLKSKSKTKTSKKAGGKRAPAKRAKTRMRQ